MKEIKFEALGTIIQIQLPKNSYSLNLEKEIKTKIISFEKKYSRFLENSYLNQLNSKLYSWQEIDLQTLKLINFGLEKQKETRYYFNMFLKERLEEIGYGNKKKNQIKKIKIPFLKSIVIKENKIFLRKQFEIGGFGKGYLGDEIYDFLNKKKIKNFSLNMGGDIKINGTKEIYLESTNSKNRVFAKIILKNQALASSSPKYRTFSKGNHLINPKSKNQKQDISQIYIITKELKNADTYATALFVAGFEKAKQIAQNLECEILLISKEKRMYKKGFTNLKFI